MIVDKITSVESTSYDRSQASVGMVHLGYGAFHRAHQAMYFDDYMEATGDLAWAIAGVNLWPQDSAAFAEVQKANGGYLLKTTTPDGEHQLRLVRSHLEFADWPTDPDSAELLLSRSSVFGVTITVTESGYYLDNNGSLNFDDPIVKQEISGDASRSVYAFLANALQRRAQVIDAPISILCCDNIRANGQMLKSNFLSYLEVTRRSELAGWVRSNVTFPNSMVDRITPRPTQALVRETDANFPGAVLNPIHAEAFTQWVLENKFANSMADLNKVGVELVSEVDPFEEAKIRILNGGHSGLAYLGALAGYETFDQVMRDSRLKAHFDAWERDEVLPGLTIELPFDKYSYLEQVAERFCNVAIADQLDRICMDGWTKMPIYVRPTLESCLAQGITPRFGLKSVASWYVYARRFSQGLISAQYQEPYWDFLKPLLNQGREEEFARCVQLWANLPVDFPHFVPNLITAIAEVEKEWPV